HPRSQGVARSERLRLPLADLSALISLRQEERPKAAPAVGRAGRLEMGGVRLMGRLVAGSEQPDASCLVWHPDVGANEAPLRPGVSGRIVYREPPPRVPRASNRTEAERAQEDPLFARVITRLRQGAASSPAVQPASSRYRQMLHLRSGDTIPCEITQITDKGVGFKTGLSDATF